MINHRINIKETIRFFQCGILFTIWAALSSTAHAGPYKTLEAHTRYLSSKNFRVLDQRGKVHLLSAYSEKQELILIGTSTNCIYHDKLMKRVANYLSAKTGDLTQILLVAPHPSEKRENFAHLPIPVLMDEYQIAALGLGLRTVGDFVILNPSNLEIGRRGNVLLGDREFSLALTDHWTQFLSQWIRPIQEELTCKLNLAPAPPLAFEQVAKIFQRACNNCHQSNPAIDYFKSYPDVIGWRDMIKRVIRMKTMPPAIADNYYGNLRGIVPPDQFALMIAWLRQGAPLGNGPDPLPELRLKFANSRPQQKPDLILKMKETHVIPAEGLMKYHMVQFGGRTQNDMWIDGMKIETSGGALHHADFYYSLKPLAPKIDDPYEKRGLVAINEKILFMFSSFNKWSQPLPPGTAYFVPKGSYILAEVHYEPTGKIEKSRLTAHLFKYKGNTPPRPLKRLGIYRTDLKIQPGERAHVVHSQYTLDQNLILLQIHMHMHKRGIAFRVSVERPDKSKELIYSEPLHRTGVSPILTFNKPISIPTGSTLLMEATYDNSSANPANPDPSKLVVSGPQTDLNEMHTLRLFYVDGNP